MIRKLSIIPILLLIAACGTLGLAPASTLEERIAYAVAQNAAVREAAANSLEAREIEVEDAQRVLQITDQVRMSLDAARVAAGAGDVQTAEGRLQLASAILIEIQNYLRKPHEDRRRD